MEAILSIRTPRTISVILAGGQNRIGPRVHGVVCQARKSAVNRGISLRASFLAGHRVIRRADWCELAIVAEPMVRIHFPPADSPSLAGFLLSVSKSRQLPRVCGPGQAAWSAETRRA